MAKFCSNCGSPVESGAKFCASCGSPLRAAQQPAPAPEPVPAQQPVPAQKPIPVQKPAPAQQPVLAQKPAPVQQPVPAPQPKPKSKSGGRIATSVICLLLSAAILIVAFWQPGLLVQKAGTPEQTAGQTIGQTTGQKTENPQQLPAPEAESKPVVASADSLTAKTDSGVTVELSPFLFDYDEALPVTVRDAGVETVENGNCRITSYDISVGDLTELGTYIDIRLPYDGTMCAPGEDPAECVGAKYFNERTGEWEDVLYDVDAENMEVVIHTDHLSRYGCFEVSSAGYRKALISNIEDWAVNYSVDLDTAKKALVEYAQGGPGETCQEIGLQVLKDVCDGTVEKVGIVGDQLDYVSNTYSGLNLGDIQFFSDRNNTINKAIGDTLSNLGKILGAVKLGAEIAKPGKTDEDIISIYKDAGMYALSFAEGGLAYAMIGVWMIDKSLTEFGNAAKNIRMENWETIYEYYNDKWEDPIGHGANRARTTAEWRDLVAKVIKASHGNQETFNALLESQVDAYARRFFINEPEDAIEEIQHRVDHMWRGALSASEKEQVIAKYKAKLYERLSSVVMKELQNDYEHQMQSQFMTELNHLKDVLNSVSEVHIYEELDDEHSAYQYGNYKFRFGKLNKDAYVPSWTGKFGKEPDVKWNVSMIGWIISGQPDHIDFWKPDKDPDVDKPEFSIDFHIDFPSCEVPIKSNFPTFEEVLGYYDNGIMTITDVQIPPELKAAMEAAQADGGGDGDGEEGCDFNFDLEGLIGQTKETPFSLVETGEMAAMLSGEGLDEIFADQGGMVYNDKTGKFAPVSFNVADEDAEYQITMSGECSYSDEQKSGVIFGCDLTMEISSGGFSGIVIVMKIAGEKPLP